MPLAAVPVVVVAVALPAPRLPVVTAPFPDVVAANPYVAAVPPFPVSALPGVAAANDHPLLARRRGRVRPPVDHDHRCLRRLCSERREAERRDRKPGQGSLPVSQRITHEIPLSTGGGDVEVLPVGE